MYFFIWYPSGQAGHYEMVRSSIKSCLSITGGLYRIEFTLILQRHDNEFDVLPV